MANLVCSGGKISGPKGTSGVMNRSIFEHGSSEHLGVNVGQRSRNRTQKTGTFHCMHFILKEVVKKTNPRSGDFKHDIAKTGKSGEFSQ